MTEEESKQLNYRDTVIFHDREWVWCCIDPLTRAYGIIIRPGAGGTRSVLLTSISLKKPEAKIETLYECLGNLGDTVWLFDDGSFPIFDRTEKSKETCPKDISRKTGRELKLNMDTWKIIKD